MGICPRGHAGADNSVDYVLIDFGIPGWWMLGQDFKRLNRQSLRVGDPDLHYIICAQHCVREQIESYGSALSRPHEWDVREH